MYLFRISELLHKSHFMKKYILFFSIITISVIASAQTKSVVYFDSNKTELKPASAKTLDSIAVFLQDKTWQMDIKGYCDNTGIDQFNQILSDFRSEAVFNYLRTKNINSTGKFAFKGFSSADPIADNTTETGKAKNRRVEIIITYATTKEEQKNATQSKQIIEKVIPAEISEEKKSFSATSTIADMEVGKTLILQNLNFEGGTAILLPEAKPTMELLLKTMKDNPTLEIEIGGHVCCFDDMPLSVLRAQTVLKYLAKKGIDESRLIYKGYSRNKPIIENHHGTITADSQLNKGARFDIIIPVN